MMGDVAITVGIGMNTMTGIGTDIMTVVTIMTGHITRIHRRQFIIRHRDRQ